MDASGWPEENWIALGEAIAKARRAKGWDQQELANRSGNSANTISNYERGRATRSRRVPSGYLRVAQALGWPPDSPKLILAGENSETVLNRPSLFDVPRGVSGRGEPDTRSATAAGGDMSGTRPGSRIMSTREIELTESGHLAQDTFMRQTKRFRKLKNVSAEELARRAAALGADFSLQDLLSLENGTRLLRMAEAKVIAVALDTTVDWLLGSGFSSDAPEEMKRPPSDEELQAEAKAVERRMAEMGVQVNTAHAQYAYARTQEEQARQQAEMAMVMLQQATAQQREMERHYQYLLGRIDSIRAAKGDEPVIQFYPVYEDDEESGGEELRQGATHAASGDKAGISYSGSHADRRRREEAARDAARKLL
ncbi:helix-turn-helix transcriptional regulator [Streptomyces mirabilis]|uniref:helix-turn-helix domain-containing protein n=1 Tax=Streptomyces mirabilis TaxID=68239 RepID=UPI0033DBE797